MAGNSGNWWQIVAQQIQQGQIPQNIPIQQVKKERSRISKEMDKFYWRVLKVVKNSGVAFVVSLLVLGTVFTAVPLVLLLVLGADSGYGFIIGLVFGLCVGAIFSEWRIRSMVSDIEEKFKEYEKLKEENEKLRERISKSLIDIEDIVMDE